MVLRADDFGCVPDGRALERVAIAAASTVLVAVDGTLRATDVGKKVAIPGAADLVATISALVDRMDIADASMTAGSAKLDTVLGPRQAFQAGVHVDRRISVAGAGPGGTTLVSDVVSVDNPTRLTLADAASTEVHHVEAILNRADRVNLSDYARASAIAVTVNLGDRDVDDAQMIVGQRGLDSATAKFSSEDLSKVVTVLAAGRLVTTIDAFESSSQVRLAVPAQRAVADGPADVWRTDSRAGFEALLLALDRLDVDGVEIEFGPGVYDFTRAPVTPGAPPGAISLSSRRNLTLRGAGPGATVLRLMPDQDLSGPTPQSGPDTHVIEARNCHNLTLRDVSVHGAYLTMGSVNEQMHGIFIAEGCSEIVVERVRVFQTAGDGVRLLGADNNKVRKVWLDKCRLIQNRRTGISFQRAVEQVWVRDCYIEVTPPSTGACIDFEPTGKVPAPAPCDVIIDSNELVHGTAATAVSISGIDGARPSRRVRFTNNSVRGGGIGGVHAQDVTLAHNTILAGERGPVITFRGNFDGLRVEGNEIVAPDAQTQGVRLARLDGFSPSNVRFVANQIDVAGIGIELDDPGSFIELRDNRIQGRGQSIGISVRVSRSPGEVHRDVRVVGNTIVNFADAGIHLSTASASEQFEGVEISANEMYVDEASNPGNLVGIRLPKPGNGSIQWLQLALVAGNRIGATVATKIGRHGPTVPYIVVAGNPGHRAIFEGDGDPEGRVAAPFGSLFLRVDAEPSTLYLKALGTGTTGWAPMALAR